MGVSIQIFGAQQAQSLLIDMPREILQKANVAIKKAGFFIEGEVKDSIAGKRAETRSVDTGQFLNSVKNVQNAPLTATIESNVGHAPFLEYGTSRFVARAHFRNTAKRNESKITDFVKTEIRKV